MASDHDYDDAVLAKIMGHNMVTGALLFDAYLKHENKKNNNKKSVKMDDDQNEVVTISTKRLKGSTVMVTTSTTVSESWPTPTTS